MEKLLSATPLKTSEIHSQRYNPVKSLGYGRLLGWNNFEGSTHANSTTAYGLFKLCGGSDLSGVRGGIVYNAAGSQITFPGNFFTSGSRVKFMFSGKFNSLVSGDSITFALIASSPSVANALSSFCTVTAGINDEWYRWKFEVDFIFYHGSTTDFTLSSITTVASLTLQQTADGIGVVVPGNTNSSTASAAIGTFDEVISISADVDWDAASADNSILGNSFEIIQYL